MLASALREAVHAGLVLRIGNIERQRDGVPCLVVEIEYAMHQPPRFVTVIPVRAGTVPAAPTQIPLDVPAPTSPVPAAA